MLNDVERFFRYTAIVGLTPYTTTDNRRLQRKQQIYTLILLILVVGTASYGVYKLELNDNLNVSNIAHRLLHVAKILATIIVILESIFTYLEHQRYYAQCRKIEQLFRRQLQFMFRERKQWHYLMWKYLLLSLVVFGSLIVHIILTFFFKRTLYFWLIHSTTLILRLRSLQILVYVDVIGLYLQALNTKLVTVVDYRNQFDDIENKQLKSLEYLLLFKGLYLEICTLAKCWNSCFGWSAFAVLTALFLEMIANLYWAFLILADLYEFHFIYTAFNNALGVLVLNFIVCLTCHQCERANRRSLSLVQKLLQPTNGDINIRIYNDLVNEFLTQIKNDPIEFGAYGIFRINLKLFMATFTSVVTYLVILIQFRTTDVDGDQGERNNSSKC